MGLLSNNSAVALVVQSAPESWGSPSSADMMPCANLRLDEAGVTIENPEYTGSLHKQGAIVAGSTVTLSFDVMLRPPGGADVPADGAYLPGRILRCAKFSENRVTVAIPASAEALSSGTTTGATLGSGAAGTAHLYKGLVVKLSDNEGGALPKALTAIRAYTAGKVATFAETLGAAPAANYQIPKQLAYVRDVTETATPVLSMAVWLGGVRYDLIDMAVTSFQLSIPASTRDQADFPVYRVTLSGDVYATADEATPTITGLGAIPLFKDGDLWVALKEIGGSSVEIDLSARSASPPNPNKPNGSDPQQLVEMRPTISLALQKYLKATFDPRALALAQAQHPVWAMWGYTAGNIVSVLASDARFNFPSPDVGSEFVTDSVEMFIDVATKNIAITFPY